MWNSYSGYAKKSHSPPGLLWICTGIFGGHRFYLKDPLGGTIIIFLSALTAASYFYLAETALPVGLLPFYIIEGCLALLLFIDACTLFGKIRRTNDQIEAKIIIQVANMSKRS
ncbi:MAG: TM2 domain-containing protein [Firmicutes bacterium]|nr:TM2 domain-containing protein [Bacillota bacterium]